MPTGAMKVARDFSAASMRMTKTRSEVRNISMKTPCVIEVPPESLVMLSSGPDPGRVAELRAVATIEPAIWAGKRKAPRVLGRKMVLVLIVDGGKGKGFGIESLPG